MNVASVSRIALGSPEGRLLSLEVSRWKAGWDNLLASAGRTDSLRAIGQILGLAIAMCVATAGYAVLLLSDGREGVEQLLAGPRGGLMATVLALLLLLDGTRRGLGLFGRAWQDRFEFEWLPTAGIPARAISLRSALASASRAATMAWIPGLALLSRPGHFATSSRVASLLVTVAFALAGDAVGRRVRFGRPIHRVGVGGVVLLAYVLCAALFVSSVMSANLSDGQARLMLGAGSPWRVSLTGGAIVMGVSFVSCWASANAALSAHRWTWAPQRSSGTSLARVVRAGARNTGAAVVVRRRGTLTVLLLRDLSRIGNWLRREPAAAGVLILASSLLHVVLVLNTGKLPRAFMPGSLPWTGLFSITLPALSVSEVLWGEEAAGMYGWTRVVTGRAALQIVSRCLATVVILLAWSAVLTLLVLVHPLARTSAVPLLGYGVLLSASAATSAAAAGAWGIRTAMSTELLGRAARYVAVIAGSALPAIVCWQRSAMTGLAFSVVLGGALLCAACRQGRRAQFYSQPS